jgi:hypothetical protein
VIGQPSIPLRLVDGRDLPDEYLRVLRPGQPIPDPAGHARRLPRFYYEVGSWDDALSVQLTPHFGLWELLDVDLREARVMRGFPRYVPCAITMLATYLEIFREAVGTVVRIAANGGYRSPGHQHAQVATPHSWGTAANIYRVGDELMHSEERIEKYTRLARRVLPGVWTRPFGSAPGHAFDHVHLDLGYVTVVPHGAADEDLTEE